MATQAPITPATFSRGKYEERLDLRRYVTPQSLLSTPIHRWFVFPHSFGRELVWELMDYWGLQPGDHILDPFVGAGTSLLAAKERGISATGVDLSPLAVFVSRTKLNNYYVPALIEAQQRIIRASKSGLKAMDPANEALTAWFTPEVLEGLMALKTAIALEPDGNIRDFFLLGLLAILNEFSLAVRDGGWLRWKKRSIDPESVFSRFASQTRGMIQDIEGTKVFPLNSGSYQVFLGDARKLEIEGEYAAVITSPPYPNRHDYSRIFNVELCFAFMTPKDVKELRHKSFRSHVEAKPGDYKDVIDMPKSYLETKESLQRRKIDKRVIRMLDGYFHDLFYTLRSLKNVLNRKAKLAFVVGNVRYKGEMVYVDKILAYLAQKVGYEWEKTWIIRYRGNSAQQMGQYGREAARESVVLLRQ